MATDWQTLNLGAGKPQLRQQLASLLREHLEARLKNDRLIDRYYLPLFIHLYTQLQDVRDRPLIIGINAPQGGGKTTLTHYLVKLFETCDMVAISLSIDDFYLTRQDQVKLAQQYPENPYLQQRGYPGTHDIELGVKTLSSLKMAGSGQHRRLPRYDKSMHQGQGDRQQAADWPQVQLPIDVVLLEGWMLGFQPADPGQIDDPHLHEINTMLTGYHVWHDFLDSFVYIHPEDPDVVIQWRSEAEERMKARGLPGMSAEDVRVYAENFLPAYRLYGPILLNRPPLADASLRVRIGKDRLPVD